jgi:hypothetical protein
MSRLDHEAVDLGELVCSRPRARQTNKFPLPAGDGRGEAISRRARAKQSPMYPLNTTLREVAMAKRLPVASPFPAWAGAP